jgi:hypothetical protein
MGEIATWSAVKTKVGLGKDSNECPTKAELLALSPTGTGENYVGLELTNASSYGNNETVQLSDIHKVTYKYTFTVVNPTLYYSALGGKSTTGDAYFHVSSTKRKYLDGVATGSDINVSYAMSDLPSWIVLESTYYKAQENTALSQRNHIGYFTQQESGKTLEYNLIQAAGVETWEYTFSVQNPNLNYTALGGSATPAIAGYNSFKQRYINGKPVGTSVDVGFSSPDLPSWIFMDDENHYTALENKSENSRSQVFTSTQNESGKKVTVTFAQSAGVKTYGTPTVYLGSIADIPASGGTAVTPTYTYSQLWGWNGKTDDGGTISSGASVVWSENISGSNLGTTAKARTKLGSRTLTVTLNGKSGSASIDVYQAENRITNVTQGAWVVSISANPSTFTEQGGTSQISASARASRTNHWSSGATSVASDATGTPTLSIPTASTGFSLSGTTLTVAENTTANQRSVVVRATMDTVYKEVTVTQSAYLVEWRYTFTASPTTLNFDALGTAKSITITSYREKYINGSLVEGSRENVSYIHATSTEHIGTVLGTSISMQENQTTSTRDGKVSYEQNGSNKVIRITCNQAAGTITQQWVLREVSGFNTIPAVGGQVVASVESGYYDVINGTPKTWHNEAPEVDTNPGWISLTSVEYANNGYYTVKATGISNGSESSRSGKLTLTNSQKSLQLDIVQSGASIGYNYYFEVTSDFPSVAAAGATPKAVIKSRRYRVVNGVEESSYTRVDVSLFSKPNWTGVLSSKVSSTTGPGADYDVTLPVYENTSESVRKGAVVLQQSGSNKRITLLINQSAAVVTWDYTFSIYSPSSKILNVPAKMIDPDTIICNSYRTKVVNGTQTSTKEFVEVTIDPIEESWLEVTKNSNDQTQAELFVTCLENKVSSIRSATVTIRQVGTSNLDQVDINQSAATVSYNYYIGFNGNPDVGGYSMNWEYTQFGSSHGQSIDLKCWRKPVINGIESDTEEAAEYEVIFSGVGIDSFTVTNTPLSYDPTITTVRAYPKSINGSVFDLKGTVQYRIADYPSKSAYLYLTHKPVATVKRWTFQWYDQVESVTIKNVSHDSSAGSISPITIISKCEYLLASNQSQVAYTEYIKPNEDEDTATPVSWGRLVENGQTAQNDYGYAYLVDENKEDYDRQATRTFTQPGNPSNKRLYLYVTQTKPVTIKQRFHAELGNYYSYGDSNQIPLIYQWYSPDSSDTTDIGDMTPGGYTGVWCNLPATGVINCMITGKPQTGKPMKARLSNLQARTIEDFDSGSPTEINRGLSVGYSQQDYQIGIEYSPGMNNYFLITPSILSEAGAYGGGIRLEVSLRSSYSNNGTTIATVTLTPKNSDHPTIYFEVIYG